MNMANDNHMFPEHRQANQALQRIRNKTDKNFVVKIFGTDIEVMLENIPYRVCLP